MKIVVIKILTATTDYRREWWAGTLLGWLAISIFEKPCFYIFVLLLLFLKRKYENTSLNCSFVESAHHCLFFISLSFLLAIKCPIVNKIISSLSFLIDKKCVDLKFKKLNHAVQWFGKFVDYHLGKSVFGFYNWFSWLPCCP